MIEDRLVRFGRSECRVASTPLQKAVALDATMSPSTPLEILDMRGVPYRELVGTLIHLTNTVRPDIAFSVSPL